jgi:molecular chaperone IbpA
MTKITSFDLSPFYRNTVGVDRLFDRITQQFDSATTVGNYPPFDTVKLSENSYEIRIAAAGFRQDEIDVELNDSTLTVKGSHRDEPRQEVDYLHHGISSRDWVRQWTLGEYVEVKGATMKDGILTIRLERVVPEAMKPRRIEIEYQA